MHLSFTRNDKIDDAMRQVKNFAAKYPPENVLPPSTKPTFRETKTALVGGRPLVRMTAANEVPDDNVPPMLLFHDLEHLHHKLLEEGRTVDMGYIGWLCRTYAGNLRFRRIRGQNLNPEKNEESGMIPVAVHPRS
jgi:hypothetical protein